MATYPEYAVIKREDESTVDSVNWRHLVPHPGPGSFSSDSVPVRSADVEVESVSKQESEGRQDEEPEKSVAPILPTNTQDRVITRCGRTVIPPSCYGFNENQLSIFVIGVNVGI